MNETRMPTNFSPELIALRKIEFAEVDQHFEERRKQNREPDDIWSEEKRAEMLCRLGDVPPKKRGNKSMTKAPRMPAEEVYDCPYCPHRKPYLNGQNRWAHEGGVLCQTPELNCTCHLGSVCTEACRQGKHHGGCPKMNAHDIKLRAIDTHTLALKIACPNQHCLSKPEAHCLSTVTSKPKKGARCTHPSRRKLALCAT